MGSRQCTVDSKQSTVGEASVRRRVGASRAALLFTVYCSLFTLAGCGNEIRGNIERGIAEALPEKIGPAKSYSVKVSGSTLAMLSGKLSGVDISGEEVRTSKGVTVARLNVSIKDLLVDTGTHVIKKCGSAGYSASIAQEELQRYLIKTYPDIPDLNVSLMSGYARVLASPALAGVKVNIAAEAKLDIREGRKLALNLTKIDVAGLPTPGFAREYIERKINPVFDIADLGFDARLDSVRIDPGSITLAGTLDLLKAMGEKGSRQ